MIEPADTDRILKKSRWTKHCPARLRIALFVRLAIGIFVFEIARPAILFAEPLKSLDECITTALAQHPSLKAGAASVDAAQQRVYQAVSGYLPQVSAVYAANRRYTSIGAQTGTGTSRLNQTFNYYNTGVSFSQMLFDFGRQLDNIRAAQASQESVEADLASQRETVIFQVKQAYFGVLAAQRLVGVAEEALRQSQQHLKLAQSRHEVGFAPRFDVTREQVQLASNELDLLSAQNNVAIARETLRNDMGLDGPLDFDVTDVPEPDVVDIDEAAALARAYNGRPEITGLQAQERATTEIVQALRKDYLPNITSNGIYQWTGNQYPLQENWNIGASVNVALFNGGLTRAQIAEAKANLATLQHNESLLRQSIALEVRQAILNLRQAGRSISVSATGLRQARENLELAEGRYQTGVGNIIEVTDAQASLTKAQAQYVQSIYNYRSSMAALERAITHRIGPDDTLAKPLTSR